MEDLFTILLGTVSFGSPWLMNKKMLGKFKKAHSEEVNDEQTNVNNEIEEENIEESIEKSTSNNINEPTQNNFMMDDFDRHNAFKNNNMSDEIGDSSEFISKLLNDSKDISTSSYKSSEQKNLILTPVSPKLSSADFKKENKSNFDKYKTISKELNKIAKSEVIKNINGFNMSKEEKAEQIRAVKKAPINPVFINNRGPVTEVHNAIVKDLNYVDMPYAEKTYEGYKVNHLNTQEEKNLYIASLEHELGHIAINGNANYYYKYDHAKAIITISTLEKETKDGLKNSIDRLEEGAVQYPEDKDMDGAADSYVSPNRIDDFKDAVTNDRLKQYHYYGKNYHYMKPRVEMIKKTYKADNQKVQDFFKWASAKEGLKDMAIVIKKDNNGDFKTTVINRDTGYDWDPKTSTSTMKKQTFTPLQNSAIKETESRAKELIDSLPANFNAYNESVEVGVVNFTAKYDDKTSGYLRRNLEYSNGNSIKEEITEAGELRTQTLNRFGKQMDEFEMMLMDNSDDVGVSY